MPIRPLCIGLITGCFDGRELHDGHRYILQTAANHCDVLIMCVNRDDYCRRIKGESRPITSLLDRMERLRRFASRLPCRTIVRVLMHDTPAGLLARHKPDIYVAGSDAAKILSGAEYCQRVLIVERLPGISTTANLQSKEVSE